MKITTYHEPQIIRKYDFCTPESITTKIEFDFDVICTIVNGNHTELKFVCWQQRDEKRQCRYISFESIPDEYRKVAEIERDKLYSESDWKPGWYHRNLNDPYWGAKPMVFPQ